MGAVVALLLDEGAWTLAESKCACDHSRRLQAEARELLLTYRYHRLRRISGSSSAQLPGDESGPEHLRARLKVLVAQDEIPKIYARDSGELKACDICRREIVSGAEEFEIAFSGLTFVLDRACFAFWQAEVFAGIKRRSSSKPQRP